MSARRLLTTFAIITNYGDRSIYSDGFDNSYGHGWNETYTQFSGQTSVLYANATDPGCIRLGGTDCVRLLGQSSISRSIDTIGFGKIRLVIDTRETFAAPTPGEACYMEYRGNSSSPWYYTQLAAFGDDTVFNLSYNLSFADQYDFDFQLRFGNSGDSADDVCYFDNLRVYQVGAGQPSDSLSLGDVLLICGAVIACGACCLGPLIVYLRKKKKDQTKKSNEDQEEHAAAVVELVEAAPAAHANAANPPSANRSDIQSAPPRQSLSNSEVLYGRHEEVRVDSDIDEKTAKGTATAIDTLQYESWDVEQIMMWILSLENGRFAALSDVLRNGLMESDIRGTNLPDVDYEALSCPPFDIKKFQEKRDLVKHFKSLRPNDADANVEEGAGFHEQVEADDGAVTVEGAPNFVKRLSGVTAYM